MNETFRAAITKVTENTWRVETNVALSDGSSQGGLCKLRNGDTLYNGWSGNFCISTFSVKLGRHAETVRSLKPGESMTF